MCTALAGLIRMTVALWKCRACSECLYCSMYIHIVFSLSPLLQDGDTPLILAALWGQKDAVKELLSSGAPVLCTNNVSTFTL